MERCHHFVFITYWEKLVAIARNLHVKSYGTTNKKTLYMNPPKVEITFFQETLRSTYREKKIVVGCISLYSIARRVDSFSFIHQCYATVGHVYGIWTGDRSSRCYPMRCWFFRAPNQAGWVSSLMSFVI
uniref:Uncharacterized protein n=1 Tax=Cacopsylla melanoneura TaxID=428564 RepID=A0A8D8TD73_9HEMI